MLDVSVLVYPGMSAFETGIVTEVFGLPRPEFERPWYRLAVCAPSDAPVPMIGGATLTTPFGLAEFAAADTVVVPGVADVHRDPPAAVLDALRTAHPRRPPPHPRRSFFYLVRRLYTLFMRVWWDLLCVYETVPAPRGPVNTTSSPGSTANERSTSVGRLRPG